MPLILGLNGQNTITDNHILRQHIGSVIMSMPRSPRIIVAPLSHIKTIAIEIIEKHQLPFAGMLQSRQALTFDSFLNKLFRSILKYHEILLLGRYLSLKPLEQRFCIRVTVKLVKIWSLGSGNS